MMSLSMNSSGNIVQTLYVSWVKAKKYFLLRIKVISKVFAPPKKYEEYFSTLNTIKDVEYSLLNLL